MNTRTKLLVVTVAVLLGFLFTAVSTYVSLSRIRQMNRVQADGLALRGDYFQMASLNQALLTTEQLPTALEELEQSYRDFSVRLQSFLDSQTVTALIRDEEARAAHDGVSKLWGMAERSFETTIAAVEEAIGQTRVPIGLLRIRDTSFSYEMYAATEAVDKLNVYLTSQLTGRLDDLVDTLDRSIDAAYLRLFYTVMGVAVAVSAAVLAVFVWVAGGLRTRITDLGHALRTVGGGDLSIRLEARGKDEFADFARTINGFLTDFSAVMRDARGVASEAAALRDELSGALDESSAALGRIGNRVEGILGRYERLVESIRSAGAAAGRIADTVVEVADSIGDQASAVAQSSAATEQMAASIRTVATTARDRQQAAGALVSLARSGGERITTANEVVREVSGEIEQIHEIIALINNVASQTNLLSMNAAIESAHAGEAGRGFAVVAEEIRRLADSTAENATRVQGFLQSITEKIANASELSEQSRQVFGEVDSEIHRMAEALTEVTHAMSELAQGSGEVLNAAESLSRTTEDLNGRASTMREGAGEIRASMDNIAQIGRDVQEGMIEIGSETRDIEGIVARVLELNTRSGSAVARINDAMAGFETGAEG